MSTHHAYVRSAMPTITRHLAKLVEVHGSRHPELPRVAAYFDQVVADLSQHMVKEEQVLFPYVRDLAEAGDACGRTQSPFGTVANPIRMMKIIRIGFATGERALRPSTGIAGLCDRAR